MSPKHRRHIRIPTVPEPKASNIAEAGPAIQPAVSLPSNGKPSAWQPRWDLGISVLIGASFLVLYLITTSRSVPTGDSGELITAAWTLGVAHSPGYPTFTLLSHLAGYLPFGNPAFRMNLLSAILDAFAIGILSWGMLRFLRQDTDKLHTRLYWLVPVAGSVAGAGILAVSNVFWLYSTVAEVFALNNLLAAITLVFMLEWVRQPERNKYLFLSGLFAGLAMTNQHSFILFMTGLLALLFGGIIRWRKQVRSGIIPHKSKKTDPGWRLRDIGIVAGLFILGLLPYIYLPIAAQTNPPINWGNPADFQSFWQVLTRSDYGTFSFAANSAQGNPLQQLLFIGRYFLNSFSVVGVLLAILGVVWVARKRQLEGIGLGLAFLFSGPIFALGANPQLDVPLTQGVFERFYILPSIPVAFLVAAGIVFLIELAVKSADKVKAVFLPHMAVLAGIVATIALVITMAVVHYPTISLSNNRIVEYYGEDLLKPLEPDTLLLMNMDYNGCTVFYAQFVAGVRTDVIALHTELLKAPWYVEQQRRLHPEVIIPFTYYDEGRSNSLVDLIKANIGQRPVYVAGTFREDLAKTYDVVYWGLTCKLVKKGEGTDSFALMKANSDLFISLRYPEKAYPAKYWESVIAELYGQSAFIVALNLSQPQAQLDAAFVERMYRIAILDNPVNPSSYKNLGILLWKNGGSPAEIIALWEKYLQMVPDDPGNADLRTVITTLKAQP